MYCPGANRPCRVPGRDGAGGKGLGKLHVHVGFNGLGKLHVQAPCQAIRKDGCLRIPPFNRVGASQGVFKGLGKLYVHVGYEFQLDQIGNHDSVSRAPFVDRWMTNIRDRERQSPCQGQQEELKQEASRSAVCLHGRNGGKTRFIANLTMILPG